MKYDSIIIVGPTASGKTSLSVELAKALNTEIINADSQQLIKGLDIGTAKVTEAEMQGVKHNMLDIIEVGQDYSVSEFREDCLKHIARIKAEGKVPVVVGGTGLYVNSIIYDYTYGGTDKDDALREEYFKLASTKGNEYVYEILKSLDPKSASEIHPNNLKRVIRAIEIAKKSKQIKSKQSLKLNTQINPLIIGLTIERGELFARIDRRVDLMIEQGLQNEINRLKEQGYYEKGITLPIGYSEWAGYYDGTLTKEQVIEQIKLDTRHYAKRQMTWFKRLDDVHWFDPIKTPLSDILNSTMQFLKESK